MNKTRFRLLVFFMSLSLVGIILVQLYWVNSSLKKNDEQFSYHIQQILGTVSKKLEAFEYREFTTLYNKYKDSTGQVPTKKEFLPYYNKKSDKEKDIIYSGNITQSDYSDSFFDRKLSFDKQGNIVYGEDAAKSRQKLSEKDEDTRLEMLQVEELFRDYKQFRTIDQRVSTERLGKLLKTQLTQNLVNTPFEFAVYNNNLATKIRSEGFTYDNSTTFNHTLFENSNGETRYQLLITFPKKKTFLFSSIVGITSLSLIFTLIIIIAYLSAINQLIKQKQISEIKTDFINNMTHEFKTPIATINLALDAIKNPKIFSDPEKVQRYLKMIRDENKRMHAQVENVLQISKLDKKELEINKDQADIHEVIEDAIEHVHLIIEAREGKLTRHFHANRTTALLNDVHFTNVLVNILDNAIKYSPDEPVIDIYTENVKDFILIKITDKGLGMSKNTQKRIFEKFYREHTGDIHNVKGHGLGLAYVKRIIDDHNCHIYVESEKGKGSTFIIKMPLIN